MRWLVASGVRLGRAVPTQGAVLAPAAPSRSRLAEGVPVRLALAARNGAGTGARSPLTPFLTPRADGELAVRRRRPPRSTGSSRTSTAEPPTAAELALDRRRDAVDGDVARRRDRPTAWNAAGWPTQVEPLVRLYTAYLGPAARRHRACGYWVAAAGQGPHARLDLVVVRGIERVRAQRPGRWATPSSSRFVYTSVLGRPPDASGLAYWTSRLGAGWTRGR